MNARSEATYTLADWGLTVLRVVLGIVFFMHGWQKWSGGIAGTEGFFTSLSIPAPGLMAPLVTLVEIVGGLALIAGVLTRLAALALIVDMLVAMFVFHLPNGFFAMDGGYELVLTLAAGCAALVLAGPGALAVDNLFGDSVLGRFGGGGRRWVA
jgi:putative oxidoreductase